VPSRIDRLASIAIVLLGVAVLGVALLALKNPDKSEAASPRRTTTAAPTSSGPSAPLTSTSTRAATPRTPSPSSTSAAPSFNAKIVPLVVLNNTTTTGLAAGAQQQFVSDGWKVTSVGNISDTIISTCAYYDPAKPNAKKAAEALQAQYPAIKRIAPRFAELPAGPLVVVLTWDYKAS